MNTIYKKVAVYFNATVVHRARPSTPIIADCAICSLSSTRGLQLLHRLHQIELNITWGPSLPCNITDAARHLPRARQMSKKIIVSVGFVSLAPYACYSAIKRPTPLSTGASLCSCSATAPSTYARSISYTLLKPCYADPALPLPVIIHL